jgi:hypothetical protein
MGDGRTSRDGTRPDQSAAGKHCLAYCFLKLISLNCIRIVRTVYFVNVFDRANARLGIIFALALARPKQLAQNKLLAAHTSIARLRNCQRLHDNTFDIDHAVKQSRCRYARPLPPTGQRRSNYSDKLAVPQDFPHQAEACEGAEAEPPHPPVDSPQDQQHHQVRTAAFACTRDLA